jgi:serine O-acetyltransferase
LLATPNPVQIVYGIDISWRAKLGPGITIFHGVGLVVGPGAEIGAGSVLYNGVTIGAIDYHKQSRLPKLGERVVVYCGAKVLGNITVGDDVVVGANAVVLKNIPDNCSAVGIPARAISKAPRES